MKLIVSVKKYRLLYPHHLVGSVPHTRILTGKESITKGAGVGSTEVTLSFTKDEWRNKTDT